MSAKIKKKANFRFSYIQFIMTFVIKKLVAQNANVKKEGVLLEREIVYNELK